MRRFYLLLILSFLWVGKSSAIAPDWRVDPAAFEASMAVTAVLFADFDVVAGAENRIAAFVAGEIRGVAEPVEVGGQWMVFLTVYGDNSGEMLEFRAYIAAEDGVFAARETLVFQANSISGSPSDPFALNVVLNFDFPPVIGEIADQVVDIGESFTAIDLGQHLQSQDGDPVRWSASGVNFAKPRLSVQVSASNIVAIAPPSPGWTGTDTLVFTAVEQTENRLTALVAARFTVRLPDRSPEISPIPEQHTRQFRSFAPLDLDDYLIERDGDEVSWGLAFPAANATGPPSWSVSIAVYELTMSATATVSLRGQTPDLADHLLGAFAVEPNSPDGLGAVRGVAAPVLVGDEQMYFLTIYANEPGEEIVFRFYDAESGAVYPVGETLNFAANTLLGSPQLPLELRAGNLSYNIDGDNVVHVDVLDPAWTGGDEVLFAVVDQGTEQELAASLQVRFVVEPAQMIYGDVTGDEQVTALDADWIAEHVLGMRVLSAFDANLADVSGDGRISPFDATLVRQYVVGIISRFPVELSTP